MDICKLIEELKNHPDASKAGMIATHLGIVRGVSLSGRKVKEIEVAYDHDAVNNIIKDIKRLPGIIEVLVSFNEGKLDIGDEIMAVAVAGDVRENVFPALIKTVNRIKEDATQKREFEEQ